VYLNIEAFLWHTSIQPRVVGINKMRCVSWLLQQPSNAFDELSTPVFVRAWAIIIEFQIIPSV
jgi:hypothetical protein